jgi:hypothetical protein
MSNQEFDKLAMGLANRSISRRDVLKWVGGALLGGVLAALPGKAFAVAPPAPGSTLPPESQSVLPSPGYQQRHSFCPAGQTLCAGTCVNLSQDPNNCGRCGNVCMGSGLGRCCKQGQCVEIGTPGATC